MADLLESFEDLIELIQVGDQQASLHQLVDVIIDNQLSDPLVDLREPDLLGITPVPHEASDQGVAREHVVLDERYVVAVVHILGVTPGLAEPAVLTDESIGLVTLLVRHERQRTIQVPAGEQVAPHVTERTRAQVVALCQQAEVEGLQHTSK